MSKVSQTHRKKKVTFVSLVSGEVFHSLAEVDLSGKDAAAIVQEINPRSLKVQLIFDLTNSVITKFCD